MGQLKKYYNNYIFVFGYGIKLVFGKNNFRFDYEMELIRLVSIVFSTFYFLVSLSCDVIYEYKIFFEFHKIKVSKCN